MKMKMTHGPAATALAAEEHCTLLSTTVEAVPSAGVR